MDVAMSLSTKNMRKSLKAMKNQQDTAGFNDSDPFTSSKRDKEEDKNRKKRKSSKKSRKSTKKKLDTVKSASQQILDLAKLDKSSNNDEFLRKDGDNIHVTHSLSENTDMRDRNEVEFNIN